MIKRGFDLALSSVMLLLSPLWGLPVAIAIKLTSRGPIFFKQRRLGRNQQPFICWKFRTMVPNDKADSQAALQDDPRITRIGKFLRCTSIDELPQFLNVWLGHMSVVGPRPHMVSMDYHYSKLVQNYDQRFLVRPGITGWAQVTGCRGSIYTPQQMQTRIDKDLWYIRNWSLSLDFKIIAKTAFNLHSNDK